VDAGERQREEYAALRATIRERGTARIVLVPVVFIGWGGTAIATAAVITVALSTLVPLMVLAAGFQAIFALHVNVERIGRYLQAYHEREGDGWEGVAMEYGRRFPSSGTDPLFSRLFVLATSVNFIPAALGGAPLEIAVLAVAHFAFLYRVRQAGAFARQQRAEDLERFRAVRESRDARQA
jgi:hypothetical protein